MRIQFQNISSPQYVYRSYPSKNQNFDGYHSFCKTAEKSPEFLSDRFNPVIRYGNKLFEHSIEASRESFQAPVPKIESCTKEVFLTPAKNSSSYAWDINKNDSQKYLIVLHGIGQNISNCQDLYQKVIEESDFAILAPEYRGFGRNNPHLVSPQSVLEDANAAYNYLVNDKNISPENIYVMGHSFGGFAATQLANNHQDIGRLILVSSIDTLKDESVNVEKGLKDNVPPVIDFLFTNFRIFRKPVEEIFNTNQQLKKINLPVDIIHSQNDRLIKVHSSEELAKMCKNLHSMNILSTGGHTLEENKINTIVNLLNDGAAKK